MNAIDDKYAQLGGNGGFLGNPLTDVKVCPDGVGHYRHYQGGSIYWHPDMGAFEIHGAILNKWSNLGWERSFLGYPLTDETTPPDGEGRFNHFQDGSIYWHPARGAFEVHGEIRSKWAELGWERSYLGYPITDETEKTTSEGVYRYNHFQGGSIYWKPDTGAIESRREVRSHITFKDYDPYRGCQWQGNWRSSWGSDTGQYHSDIHVDLGAATADGVIASGSYNNGKLTGKVIYVSDQLGLNEALRFIGRWERTSGHSGGPCQSGQFSLDLTYDAFVSTCSFWGHWSYCEDNLLYSEWSWWGNMQ